MQANRLEGTRHTEVWPGRGRPVGLPRLSVGHPRAVRIPSRGAITGVSSVPSTVEQLSPTRVKITVEVPFADLKPSMDKAYA